MQRAVRMKTCQGIKGFWLVNIVVHCLKHWCFLLHVVKTWMNCGLFTEESTSLHRLQRMLVDSGLVIGGLGHKQ